MSTSGVRRAILLAVFALTLTFVPLDPSSALLKPSLPLGPPRLAAQEESPTATPTPQDTPTPMPTVTPTPDSPAEATPTPTPTPVLTTPPGPIDVTLPPLADVPADAGTVTEGTVGPAGGQISSGDGRVSIVFPPGATSEDLTIRITRLDRDGPTPLPRQGLITAWDIRAFAVGRGMAAVDRFDSEVTLYFHFGAEAMSWANPLTLRLWTLDEATGEWEEVSGQELDPTGIVSVSTDHLSVWGGTADPAVDTAPFSDALDVNLQTGAATASIPIELPPAPGGLVPELALTYDSSRVDAMRADDALGSWVGIGWSLAVGSIRETGEDLRVNPPAYFLELGGSGLRLYHDPESQSETDFLGYRHNYMKIEASREDCEWEQEGQPDCYWTVMDKEGRKYIFGGTLDSRQYRIAWRSDYPNQGWRKRYYRWDLSRIEDMHGNRIDVTYWQQFTTPESCGVSPPCWAYVLSAYPEQITYGLNGVNQVIFHRGFDDLQTNPDEWPYNSDDPIELRADTPRTQFPHAYSPPQVMETHRLDSIDVMVDGQRARTYEFTYTTTEFYIEPGVPHAKGYAGWHVLGNLPDEPPDGPAVTFKGREGGELRKMEFEYYDDLSFSDVSNHVFTWPHLKLSKNGFGGEVTYDYSEMSNFYCPFYGPWSHQVVVKKKQIASADQPDVVTDYEYPGDPWEVEGDYRGFREVMVTDHYGGETTQTTHRYYTTGLDCSGGSIGPEDFLSGLEYETEVASGWPLWLKTENDWQYEPLAGQCSAAYHPFECSNFAYLAGTTQILRDGTNVRTRFEYDDRGNQTKVYRDGKVYADGSDDPADSSVVERPYHWNETNWIFLPKYEQVKTPGDVVLAETSFFYDGATSRDTPPTTGDITAVQSVIDGSNTSNAYREYDAYGNLTKQSAPTPLAPGESGAACMPAGSLSCSTLSYDLTSTYVVSETNPLNQTATYTVDPILGSPTELYNPDGSHVSLRFDEFGRLTKTWDELDSEADPTTEYEYYWINTTGPKWTNVIHRADGDNTLWETHCYDGFGRQIQVRTPLTASSHSVVDTRYDERGLQHWVSNPYEDSNSGCSAANEAIPRTTYAYNPLGQATQVTNPDGTSSAVDYNGLTTTTIDANGHKKVGVADAFGRTVRVEEYTGTNPSFTLYATTSYSYDLLGNLTEVEDEVGNLTTMTYDMLGRKTAMSDPDAGDWEYVYDVAGNLIEEVDPYAAHSGRTYDVLNRVTSRWYGSPSSPVAEFTYDSYPDGVCSGSTAVGRLTKMEDGSGTTYWCYDERGRVVLQRKVVDGETYDAQSTYDSANRLVDLTYPDGEMVTHSYDPVHGQLTGLSSSLGGSYLSNVAYNAALQPTSLPLGNGLATTYSYDSRLRATSITTGSAQSLAYTYDVVGNVATITDGGTQTTFGYDELNRLVSASGGYTAAYEYNQIGNMTRKQEGAQDLDLLYGNPDHAHAATLARDRTTGANVTSLTYDARGNLTADSSNIYEYDMDNHLVAVRTSPDDDGDGCTAASESYGAPSPKPGSTCSSPEPCYSDSRWYDFYDVPVPARADPQPNGTRDKVVNVLDVLAVARYSDLSGGGGRPTGVCGDNPNNNGIDYDCDKNGDGRADGLDYDRTAGPLPSPPWEAGMKDGVINILDVQVVAHQAGQSPTMNCLGDTNGHLVAQYAYDGQGALVKRTMVEEDSWTVYIGGIYEKRSDGTYVKYYSAFGRRIATRDSAGVVNYILADHLGSSTMITDGAGAEVGTMKYYPYGAERSSTGDMLTDKLFTGQQKESLDPDPLGLYDYGARFYSTLTGRFLSPDPIIAAPGDPQMLNRYSYVRNNPLIFVDPSGLTMVIVCGAMQSCEEGNIESFSEWVINYWIESEGMSEGDALIRWTELVATMGGDDHLSDWFMVLFYDVLFIDTGVSALMERGMYGVSRDVLDRINSVVGLGPIEVLLGFSEGASVVNNMLHILVNAGKVDWVSSNILRVILVQPEGRLMWSLEANDLPVTRIITVNAPQGPIQGFVNDAINVTGSECGDRPCIPNTPICAGLNHCTMEESAPFVMNLAFLLPTSHSVQQDLVFVRLLQGFGYDVDLHGH